MEVFNQRLNCNIPFSISIYSRNDLRCLVATKPRRSICFVFGEAISADAIYSEITYCGQLRVGIKVGFPATARARSKLSNLLTRWRRTDFADFSMRRSITTRCDSGDVSISC